MPDFQGATELFDTLWANKKQQRICAERLAQSIKAAHQAGPSSWVVTSTDSHIRLNVGQVLTLQFDSERAFWYERISHGRSVYKAVRVPSRSFECDIASLAGVSSSHWRRHEAFITAAAERKKTSPWKKYFSGAVMSDVEKLIGTRLPRPNYSEPKSLRPKSGGVHFAALTKRDQRYLEFFDSFLSDGELRVTYAEIAASGRQPNYRGSNKANDRGVISRLEQAGLIKTDKLGFSFTDAALDQFDNRVDSQSRDIRVLENDKSLSETQRATLVLARRGQGRFRDQLIEIWKGCAATKCRALSILKASHIRPWSECSSGNDRLDPFNGLLLVPNLDALFDQALISFDDSGKIMISRGLSKNDRKHLGVAKNLRIAIRPEHAPYLRHHNEIFKKRQHSLRLR